MQKKEFLNLIEDALEADENTLTGDELLENLDLWDSLAIVTFIAMVDGEFDVTLSPEKIEVAKTIQDLIALLGDKIVS